MTVFEVLVKFKSFIYNFRFGDEGFAHCEASVLDY